MRAVLAASVPTVLLLAGAFFACGGGTDGGTGDSGKDAKEVKDSGLPEIGFEAPVTEEAGVLCTIQGNEGMMPTGPKYDPVAYCVERAVLQSQHQYAFSAKSGAATSWNYMDLLPDPGVMHDVRNDASYGSSLTTFFQWSQRYADSPSLDGDGGTVASDLNALAPILEKELATLPPDYDGELYFNLRNVSLGLKLNLNNDDAQKIDAIAKAYAQQIYNSFYFPLPLAGTGDAGGPKEGGPSDGGGTADGAPSDGSAMDAGGGDPGATGDGIIGLNQQPMTGSPGILYQPDKVATAASALLDLAANNPGDADVGNWILAARRALDHIHDKAREPATGLYYASLVTTGASTDALGNLTTPQDLLSSSVQATVILYLIRSKELVTAETELIDDGGPEAGIPLDAPLSGVLAPMGDFPFLSRSDTLIASMDPLWDGAKTEAGLGKQGYMDGLVSSTHTLITTKSTRPNAYMFAALHLQLWLELKTQRLTELNGERVLLANELPGAPVMDPGMNTGFIDVVPYVEGQTAYFDTVTQGYDLLDASAGTGAQSFTASAVAATLSAFNEQLVGFQPH